MLDIKQVTDHIQQETAEKFAAQEYAAFHEAGSEGEDGHVLLTVVEHSLNLSAQLLSQLFPEEVVETIICSSFLSGLRVFAAYPKVADKILAFVDSQADAPTSVPLIGIVSESTVLELRAFIEKLIENEPERQALRGLI